MTCVRRRKGWKIRLEDGRILPKIYKTLTACKNRISQMERHRKK